MLFKENGNCLKDKINSANSRTTNSFTSFIALKGEYTVTCGGFLAAGVEMCRSRNGWRKNASSTGMDNAVNWSLICGLPQHLPAPTWPRCVSAG